MNELPNLFAALDKLDAVGSSGIHVCLLLDGCIDASADLAAAFQMRSPHCVWIEQVPRTAANAGIARHRAMLLGLRALDGNGLLFATDADSVPAQDWLQTMAAALKQADVVAGRIVRMGTTNPLQDRLEDYYDRLFALRRQFDPVPWEAQATHHYAGGANIGICANAYCAIGGFVPLACGEDARLIDDASRAGLRVRRDAASLVRTSARRNGRALGGLATSLRQLDGTDARAIIVAHPTDAVWQYRMHSIARDAYGNDRLDLLAKTIGLCPDHVRRVASDCKNGEAFSMRLVPEPPGGMRRIALPAAERELTTLYMAREAA